MSLGFRDAFRMWLAIVGMLLLALLGFICLIFSLIVMIVFRRKKDESKKSDEEEKELIIISYS
jgi:hypothetical protein